MNTEQEVGTTESKSEIDKPSLSNVALFLMLVKLKGKVVLNYILDAFAPVAAVAALIVAVMALNGGRGSQESFKQLSAKIDSLSSSLASSKTEVEKLKADLAQQGVKIDERNLKQVEHETQIIQSVSKIQKKLKITPVLDEQMAGTVTGVSSQPVSSVAAAPAQTTSLKNFVSAKPLVAAESVKKPVSAKTQAPTQESNKSAGGIDELKDAINKFNKK